MLHYARLLIEMSLEGNFLEFIEFLNDKDVLVRQQVKYEWKPIYCTHCQKEFSGMNREKKSKLTPPKNQSQESIKLSIQTRTQRP